MDPHGTLNPESESRLAKSCQLANEHDAILVSTGWDYRKDCFLQIGIAMRDRAIDAYGISPDRVLVDTAARDTVGDAVFTKLNLANGRNWSRICVVTSDYHAARSLQIFRFVYGAGYMIDAVGVPAEMSVGRAESEMASLNTFSATFSGIESGDDVAILTRLLGRHPFYNGEMQGKQ